VFLKLIKMSKKIILVLLSGQLRFFSKKNYDFLIKNFSNYKLEFFITCWNNEKEETKNFFKSYYKPIKLDEIENKSFLENVEKIKVPDTAVNSENIFHMWYALSEGFKKINTFKFNKRPDYILRYRSDILPIPDQKLSLDKLGKKDILIPDRHHWNGVNDQFYIFNFTDLKYFLNLNVYLKDYLSKRLLFSPELIFQRFLKNINFNIKYSNYDYKLMRNNQKNKLKLEVKEARIPLREKLVVKINKIKFRMRNFRAFYIKKSNRNNQQNVEIK